jgi:3-oxoacyl-[acyl-carrier protein] reductase
VNAALRFAGRTAVVTGAASGFGRAIAARLARSGALVTIVDVAANGDEVAAGLEAPGGAVKFAHADVRDAAQVEAAFRHAHDRAGRLDIAVNNAGVLGGGWIHEDGADDYVRRQLDVNVLGVWYGCRCALELMRPQRAGVIVNTASPAALVPTPGAVAYGMTKAASDCVR